MALKKRKKFNTSSLVQKAKEGGKSGGISYITVAAKRYKMHAKKNRLSIIPFEVTQEHNYDGIPVGDLWPKASVLVHTGVGVNKQMVLCPRMQNKKCPLCEAEERLREDGAAWDDPQVIALRAKKRELYNVIDEDKPEDGLQILESSYHTFGKFLDAEIEDDDENGSYPDPDNGMIVVARGAEDKFAGRTFIKVDKISFEEREPISDEVLDSAHDLHAILKFLSYDELVNMINGGEDEEPKPKKRTSHAEEDDEDDEPRPRHRHHVDEDSDDEEEQPRRRRRTVEDEDEDHDDAVRAAAGDPDEPEPRRRKSASKHEDDDDDDFPWETDAKKSSTADEEDESSEDETETDSDEDDEEFSECAHFGECGYDDDVCDDCDDWRECKKETDRRLKAKRSK